MSSNIPRNHFPSSLAKLYDWLDGADAVATKHSAATAATFQAYESKVTTDGNGTNAYNLGNAPAIQPGRRKLVTLAVKGAAGDSVVVDFANVSQGADTIASVILDTAGEFLLVEWRGAKWEVIAASAGVVTTS